jgi:diguanylate cyclase (GGDEF)-like protein
MRGDETAARSAGWLFIIGGVITIVTAFLPSSAVVDMTVLIGLGLVCIIVGLTTWLLPWHRWSPRATIVLAPTACALIAAGDRYGSSAPYTYAIWYVVVFMWVGLSHPRRTALWLAPSTAVFYVAPLIGRTSAAAGGIESVAVAVSVCVLVGETVSWALSELQSTRDESEHRARLLRTVARAATTISALDDDEVLSAVADSVTGLGFTIASFGVFSENGQTYTIVQPRGLPREFADQVHTAETGLPAAVRKRRETVVVDDYASYPLANPAITALGIRAGIATPVWVRGRLQAVLIGATAERMRLSAQDVEAFELLAHHAGRALENAHRFDEERRAKELLAEVSIRDELTGVGNRRHAVTLLDSLQPGDAVVMIDLDNFKAINDASGHDAGDRVLVAVADHLRASVRDADLVARYGGEEFIVVLRRGATAGVPTAERLLATWRDSHPATTFSAGVAVHEDGWSPALTLAKADAALYAAKRQGRDQVCMHPSEAVVRD